MKLLTVAVVCLSLNALAHEMPAPKISAEFESMKALLGTWEGKNSMHGKEETVKVTYELTSGGTAIAEKMSPGTPHEMLTVYANNGDKVHATHFCAMGNQPEMKLKKAEGTTFTFEMEGTKGLSSKNEMHMHSLTITLAGNKLKEEWTSYTNNKKAETAVFEYTKKN